MQTRMAEFQIISGHPSVSNTTGTILDCECDRSLACPRLFLIRRSVLGATIATAPPTGLSHSWSHRRVASSWTGFHASLCRCPSEVGVRVYLQKNTPREKTNRKDRIVYLFCYCDKLFSIRWTTHWNEPDE